MIQLGAVPLTVQVPLAAAMEQLVAGSTLPRLLVAAAGQVRVTQPLPAVPVWAVQLCTGWLV